MVRAGDRQPEIGAVAAAAGRSGRADVQQVVAALGERLDDAGSSGRRRGARGRTGSSTSATARQPAVDVRVRADHLDVEARDAALADLVERARDAVH